ncbi:Regulatory protein OS=Streptomyces tendae OX=1932 GN=GUR47_36565 PE=4 SV=1 [Streptomyces tendae]
MFNPFEELFSPGRKHTRDEQNRLELTRVDVGDGDPGRGPIDLTSGKVVVQRPRTDATEAPDADEETGDA